MAPPIRMHRRTVGLRSFHRFVTTNAACPSEAWKATKPPAPCRDITPRRAADRRFAGDLTTNEVGPKVGTKDELGHSRTRSTGVEPRPKPVGTAVLKRRRDPGPAGQERERRTESMSGSSKHAARRVSASTTRVAVSSRAMVVPQRQPTGHHAQQQASARSAAPRPSPPQPPPRAQSAATLSAEGIGALPAAEADAWAGRSVVLAMPRVRRCVPVVRRSRP